jgi:SAM-dependent methyltransferase
MTRTAVAPMSIGLPPDWSLRRPKGPMQAACDLIGAPLRMVLLPDHVSERLHLTSLRAERFAAVFDELRGRVLDIGAGDNTLIRLYRQRSRGSANASAASESIGVDVVDWAADCTILRDCRRLPFPDASFDTVSFVACLNHIPERREALAESHRVLRPNGRLVITMIGRLIGEIGHAIWWYSEDKRRDVAAVETMGLDPKEVTSLIAEAGFVSIKTRSFGYGLNRLYTATT